MPNGAIAIDVSDWRACVAVFARLHWRPILVAVVALALTATYLFGNPYIFYHDSDPLTYFRKAWWILGRPGGIDVASRGPGYPIWLILTGAATLDRWWFLMASQFAMAAAAPVLVYGMLAPVSRNAALAAALLFAGFGIPYINMNWILTEQVFLFFELLALMLIARYLHAPPKDPVPPLSAEGWPAMLARARHWLCGPYPIVLVLAYDTMIRPTSGPLFWIFLAICLLFRLGPARRYAGPVALYVSLMLGWGTYVYYFGADRFPTLAAPSTEAQRDFADAYYGNSYAAVEPGPPAIRPEDGPASKRLYAAVESQIAKARAAGAWNTTDAVTVDRLYRRFGNDAVLAREIFARTNPIYFIFVLQAAASEGGDRLLYQVAREHGTAGLPGLIRHFAKQPTTVLTGPPNPYLGYMMMQKFYLVQHYRALGYSGLRDFISGPLPSLIRDENGPASKLMTELSAILHAYVSAVRIHSEGHPRSRRAQDAPRGPRLHCEVGELAGRLSLHLVDDVVRRNSDRPADGNGGDGGHSQSAGLGVLSCGLSHRRGLRRRFVGILRAGLLEDGAVWRRCRWTVRYGGTAQAARAGIRANQESAGSDSRALGQEFCDDAIAA